VFPGLGEFLRQSLGPEHRVTEPLEHFGFLPGPLHDILQKGSKYLSISFYWNSTTQGYSHVPSSFARPAASPPSCVLLLLGR
jgi:hypothetical protein